MKMMKYPENSAILFLKCFIGLLDDYQCIIINIATAILCFPLLLSIQFSLLKSYNLAIVKVGFYCFSISSNYCNSKGCCDNWKSDNYVGSKGEKSNVAIAMLENLTICQGSNLFKIQSATLKYRKLLLKIFWEPAISQLYLYYKIFKVNNQHY